MAVPECCTVCPVLTRHGCRLQEICVRVKICRAREEERMMREYISAVKVRCLKRKHGR